MNASFHLPRLAGRELDRGLGISLHIIAIFVGGALGMPLETTVIVLGAVITVMALTGGSWAVSVSFLICMCACSISGPNRSNHS